MLALSLRSQGADSDELYGDRGRDTIRGGDGDDIIFGNTNVQGDPDDSDWLEGGAGADFVQGNVGRDTVLGGDGADTLRGGADDDTVEGGAGADLLWGDLGIDRLTGGSEDDVFAFLAGHSAIGPDLASLDRITDFDQAGDDRLDLGAAGTDANYREAGQTAGAYEEALALANGLLGGAVIYAAVGFNNGAEAGVLVFWDANGDGDADLAIMLGFADIGQIDALDII